MASSVQVLLPSFGYTYTFTGVLSVKHWRALMDSCHLSFEEREAGIHELSGAFGCAGIYACAF